MERIASNRMLVAGGMASMNVIGYVRVSTDRQAEEGLGLEIQEAAVRAWAREHGYRLVGMFRDEGVSGSNGVEARNGLPEALDAIRVGEAEGLIVARLDRLARKLSIQEGVLAQVWTMGGRVFSVDTGEILQDDPDDPVRTAMRQMIGVFAELERGMIRARLRAGRRRKAENGDYIGTRPPFGFRVENGALVEDATEQCVLVRMRELRLSGSTLAAIADTLDREGMRPRHAERWAERTLSGILRRERLAERRGG